MKSVDRKLRVFLCHASQDTPEVALRKPIVRELYQRQLLAAPQGGDKGWTNEI